MSFYWNNLLRDLAPRRKGDGALSPSLPVGESKISGIAGEGSGKAVVSVFKRPQETIGHAIGLGSEHLTGAEVAQAFSAVLGEPVAYEPMSHYDFRALGFPSAVEIGNMLQYHTGFPEHILSRRDAELTRSIVPTWLTLKEFLAAHRAEIVAG